jgi:hypothetical protein
VSCHAPDSTATKYAQADDAVVVDLEEERVLFSPHDSGLHHLNGSATLVWECLNSPATVDEIVSDFVAVFGIPEERMREEVTAVVGRLVLAGAVRPVDEGT